MNFEEFILRLKKILSHYNLTSSTFADTIDVQRSSMSHLMSGRNKPSLDFILKIVDKFPEVDLYWLLNGQGSFPKVNEPVKELKSDIPSPSLNKAEEEEPISLFTNVKDTNSNSVTNVNNSVTAANPFPIQETTSKKLVKVVLLYNDGTFEEFNK